MNQQPPQPGTRLPEVALRDVSREYEDYLDWQENQRHDRTKRNRGHRVGLGVFGVSTLFATAFAFAGALMRRR